MIVEMEVGALMEILLKVLSGVALASENLSRTCSVY